MIDDYKRERLGTFGGLLEARRVPFPRIRRLRRCRKEGSMRRMGLCNRLRPEKVSEYKALHAAAWPSVLATITACNIRNFSIFLREPENLLFAYWEYHGEDFAVDARKMAADPITQRWWKLTDPCQRPLESVAPGENWANMEEVFFHP